MGKYTPVASWKPAWYYLPAGNPLPEACNTIKQCQIPGCLPAPTCTGHQARATVRWTYTVCINILLWKSEFFRMNSGQRIHFSNHENLIMPCLMHVVGLSCTYTWSQITSLHLIILAYIHNTETTQLVNPSHNSPFN